ncbi:hypothetical protein MD484_g1437, partial [Candolleomyces efflorescens]
MAPTDIPVGDSTALLALVSPLLSSLLLSYLFAYGLQGILMVQVYNYYISFPNDKIFWKILVYFVLISEIVQTSLASLDAFKIFSSGWGRFAILDDMSLLYITPIMSGAIGLICHGIFAYRLYSLSGSWIVCLIVVLLALLACSSGFAFGIKLSLATTLSKVIKTSNIYLVCGLWNGGGAGCDVAIAALMTFYLSRSSTGYKSTDVLLTRIIRLTIETGLFTATASLLSAILFIGYRTNFKISIWFIVPAGVLAKLYAITILAMFNNRVQGINRMNGSSGASIISRGGGPEMGIQAFDTSRRPSRAEIRIGRSVVQQVWADDIEIKSVKVSPSDLSATSVLTLIAH